MSLPHASRQKPCRTVYLEIDAVHPPDGARFGHETPLLGPPQKGELSCETETLIALELERSLRIAGENGLSNRSSVVASLKSTDLRASGNHGSVKKIAIVGESLHTDAQLVAVSIMDATWDYHGPPPPP